MATLKWPERRILPAQIIVPSWGYFLRVTLPAVWSAITPSTYGIPSVFVSCIEQAIEICRKAKHNVDEPV